MAQSSRQVFSSLVRLLPVVAAEVGSFEVMVSVGVLGTVLLKSGLVTCETSLLQGKWILSSAHLVEANSVGSLEGLSGLEARLEVHPVLSGIAKLLLYHGRTLLIILH